MDSGVSVARAAVREWVAKQRGALEAAQASGKLARAKLDIRDEFEAAFPTVEPEQKGRLLATFDQELEAFCADIRLASVTVQQQVERVKKNNGCLIALMVIIVIGVIIVAIASGNS